MLCFKRCQHESASDLLHSWRHDAFHVGNPAQIGQRNHPTRGLTPCFIIDFVAVKLHFMKDNAVKKHLLTLCLASALALSAVPVYAAGGLVSADQLHEMLNGSLPEQAIAYGYISGVSDAGDRVHHCIPAGIRIGTINQKVGEALAANSRSRRDLNGAEFVGVVLRVVWPCPR